VLDLSASRTPRAPARGCQESAGAWVLEPAQALVLVLPASRTPRWQQESAGAWVLEPAQDLVLVLPASRTPRWQQGS